MKLFYIFLLCPFFLRSQEIPKKSNTITVTGVSFKQCVTGLLDAGFMIDKIDSNYMTVRTTFIPAKLKNGKDSECEMSIDVRVKDSVATITGRWFNKMFIGLFTGGGNTPGPNDIYKTGYYSVVPKMAFSQMVEYAQALKGNIAYSQN